MIRKTISVSPRIFKSSAMKGPSPFELERRSVEFGTTARSEFPNRGKEITLKEQDCASHSQGEIQVAKLTYLSKII